jgi:hypothetical protein
VDLLPDEPRRVPGEKEVREQVADWLAGEERSGRLLNHAS